MTIKIRILLPFRTSGLMADANIFKTEFVKYNCDVIISLFNDKLPKDKEDIHLFVSGIDSKWFPYSKIKLFMVNHELLDQNDKHLKSIDYCLCRTNIGLSFVESVKKINNLKYITKLIKFTSNFQVINDEKNWNLILHSAGEHHWKQTDSVIKCWQNNKDLPLIIITCTGQCYNNITKLLKNNIPSNMLLFNKLINYNDFVWLKNVSGIHLCPSIIEGYGHYINEARLTKNLIITSNLEPMSELVTKESGILIDCSYNIKKKNGIDLCIIKQDQIYNSVKQALNMSVKDRQKLIDNSYTNFVNDTNYFVKQMEELINELIEKLT